LRRGDLTGNTQTYGVALTVYFGIDLTSGEARPSACVAINERFEIVFHGLLASEDRIIATVHDYSSGVTAIDAPLSLPSGLCCLEEDCPCKPESPYKGRECERRMAKEGIPCYFTTKKSIIKKMVYRGIRLAGELRQHGYDVIEVYPYASKRRLFGSHIPKKTTSAGIAWLRNRLNDLFHKRDIYTENWSHDLCDAAIAAYTGFLHMHGNTEALGESKEGYIYLPRI
jgi:predicted nuclease with RNAse H fold